MEERRLVPEDLEPKFRVLITDEHQWKVTDHLHGDFDVEHRDGFYHCLCNKEDETPWQECVHVLAVQQYELQQFESNVLNVGFKAHTDSILWQIGQLEAEIASNDESANHQIRRIELWRQTENRKLEKNIDSKAFLLRNYLFHTGRRTENLVNGTIRLRKQQPKITVTEAFDLDQESFVRIIPQQRKPDLRAIRKHLTETGEIVRGTEVEMQPDKLSWEVSLLYNNVKGEDYESDESTLRKVG